MNTSNATTPVRELMPDRFTRLIAQKSKELIGRSPDTSRISDIVAQELYTSKYWPAVEAVAKQVDPVKYEERMAYLKEETAVEAAA